MRPSAKPMTSRPLTLAKLRDLRDHDTFDTLQKALPWAVFARGGHRPVKESGDPWAPSNKNKIKILGSKRYLRKKVTWAPGVSWSACHTKIAEGVEGCRRCRRLAKVSKVPKGRSTITWRHRGEFCDSVRTSEAPIEKVNS